MFGAAGNGLCFDCRHEWDPRTVTALPSPVDVPAAVPAAVPDEAAVPDGDVVAATYTWGDLIGSEVVVYGADRATVVAFPDDDHVLVDRGEGLQELVEMNDVRQAPPAKAAVPDGDVAVDDETAAAFSGAVLALSNLIVRAGIVHGWPAESTELADLLAGVRDLAYDTARALATDTTSGGDDNVPATDDGDETI
jgi:hypothetical protein